MIIRKKKLPVIFLIVLAVLFPLLLLIGRFASRETVEYILSSNLTIPVTDTDLPLPIPAEITAEKDGIRLDLERISVNKYYIIYSVIYGDQSHTAYHLYLTDLNREKLNPEEVGDIWLETTGGEKITQVTMVPEITGFPADQPLGWKIAINAKFPYQTGRKNHNLYLQYQDKTFRLSDIYY